MEENVKFDKKSLKLVQGKTADFGEIAKDCVAFANTYGGFLTLSFFFEKMAEKGAITNKQNKR